jgi:hypothetical protein
MADFNPFLSGTGAVVHYIGKREAEADPQLLYTAAALPYAYPLAYTAAVATGGNHR